MDENTREKLIIDVKTWLHREGGEMSKLLRNGDGKRCCMGIYLQNNHGVKPDDMLHVACPSFLDPRIKKHLPHWLFDPVLEQDSQAVCFLMRANDDLDASEEDTRGNISRLFAEVGVDVGFVEEKGAA